MTWNSIFSNLKNKARNPTIEPIPRKIFSNNCQYEYCTSKNEKVITFTISKIARPVIGVPETCSKICGYCFEEILASNAFMEEFLYIDTHLKLISSYEEPCRLNNWNRS